MIPDSSSPRSVQRGPFAAWLALAALCALTILTTSHCRGRREAAPDVPAEAPRDAPDTAAASAPPGGTAPRTADDARIRALVGDLARRGRCTLLMGCEPAEALLREGNAAAAPLMEFYRLSGGDAYWRSRILDLLGRVGAEDVVPFLVERLQDPAERLQADAALALGHRKAREAETVLRERHAATALEADPGLRLALAYALARLGGAAERAEIHAALAPERADGFNAGQLQTLLTIVRWLDERDREDVRAFVRRALGNENRLVRREAVRLVRDWRLRSAVGALVPLLDDVSPGVRDAALETLQSLTGFRHKQSREQWERWCRETADCELPAPAAAAPAPDRAITAAPSGTPSERCERLADVVFRCGGFPKDPTLDSATQRNNELVVRQEMVRACLEQPALAVQQRCAAESGDDCRAFADCVRAGQASPNASHFGPMHL